MNITVESHSHRDPSGSAGGAGSVAGGAGSGGPGFAAGGATSRTGGTSSPGVGTTISLATNLATARLGSRKGAALLDGMAVLAFAVSAWLTLTTLGGVWMFWVRQGRVEEILHANNGIDPDFTNGMGRMYVGLAILALALLAVPLLSLGGAAARLGANGRARRLASLRLIGVSARQVVGMSMVETLIQTLVGFALGFTMYFASLPLWHGVSFHDEPIGQSEMMLPWWGVLAALALTCSITLASTAIGLRKVSISPLGVARRETPAMLKSWRVVILVVAVALLLWLSSNFSPFGADIMQFVTMAAVVVIFFSAISLAGPWFIQLATRSQVVTRSPAKLIAARRIIGDPRAAWRNVSAVSLLALVATIATTSMKASITSTHTDDDFATQSDRISQILMGDVVTGVMIAFVFSIILGAVSTLIHQASDVFDRADETTALVEIGTPLATLHKARFIQVLAPLMLMLVITVTLGMVPSFAASITPKPENLVILAAMVGLGILLTLAAISLTVPIQKRVLADQTRKND